MGEATLTDDATGMDTATLTAAAARTTAAAGDLELLRRHEPLLQFTHGELFFPIAAEVLRQRVARCWKARHCATPRSSSPRG